MRRFISAVLASVMLSLLVLPCQAKPIRDNPQDEMIYVDYEEFHSNRAYYDTLLLQGYGICVYVGDEYADKEIERLSQPVNTLHILTPSSQSRGTSVPTAELNIHAGYHFTCNANYDFIYTNYKFYGCLVYMFDGFNTDYSNNLRIRVFGTINGTVDYVVPPRSVLYKYFGVESESSRIFAGFYPPSHAYGEIYCIGH